jgi:PAS domain S-box-containing protein
MTTKKNSTPDKPDKNPTGMIFKAAPVGLYIKENGVLTRVAAWLSELLGYETSEELANTPFEEILHPEDREKAEKEMGSGENRTGAVQVNVRVLKKDGAFIWMSLRESPATSGDTNLKIGRFVEITPVKQLIDHQNRLNAMFGKIKDSVIMLDAELRVLSINSSTRTLCGIIGRNVIGQVLSKYPAPCSKGCCEVLEQVFESKTAVKDIPVECRANARPHQVVSVNSSPFIDPEGRFVGAVLVAKDITLLKNIEKELEDRHQFQNIIGKSKKMQDIYKLLEDLADLETTVLFTGESGTGKELMAKALHYSGKRAAKPFITVNCSALAEGLLESELFGHVKGAFTGAVTDKIGRFQAADGGSILLDEIGDISPLIQLKLLRVIQEKEFERVGESVPRKVDVRVIACTNKDLKAKVKTGEFREDLYYRLKVVEIPLPPLRERLEDVPLLVNHACNQFNKIFNKSIQGISGDVLGLFMEYPWPGNVRELKHAIECAFVLCHEKVINVSHLPGEIRHFKRQLRVAPSHAPKDKANTEKDLLEALNKTFWNKTSAAYLLGISRQTLYRKIREFGIVHKDVTRL